MAKIVMVTAKSIEDVLAVGTVLDVHKLKDAFAKFGESECHEYLSSNGLFFSCIDPVELHMFHEIDENFMPHALSGYPVIGLEHHSQVGEVLKCESSFGFSSQENYVLCRRAKIEG